MIIFLLKTVVKSTPYFSDDVLKYLIPTSVTIFVFTLGLLTAWVKANIERRRQYQQLRSLFITWIPNFERPVIAYAANCDDFSARLNTSERLSSESMALIPLNVDKLASIDINQMVKTFIYNTTGDPQQNNEQLYYMVSNLEYLVNLGPEMEAKYNEHYISTNNLLKEWNAAFIELSDLQLKVFKNQTDKSEARLTMEKQLRTNIINWTAQNQDNPQNTVVTYNHLLVPNLKSLNSYFQQTKSEEQVVVDLTAALHRVTITYRQWRASHEGYAIVFINYGDKLRNCYERLQASIDYFELNTKINLICT